MGFPELSMFEELAFEELSHTYSLKGEKLPSVSSIMAPLTTEKYSGISQSVLDRAAYRGTAVHNSIENYLKYEIDDVELEHRAYFHAFQSFWADYRPELFRSEIRMYHRLLHYAGTADLLCRIDGRLILVDYKSTAEIYEMTCRVQLEAYWQALASHGIMPEEKWILHLKKNGSYSTGLFPTRDTEAWRVFGALKNVHDYLASYSAAGNRIMRKTNGRQVNRSTQNTSDL